MRGPAMISIVLDRLEARLSPARFPKPESVPQVEAPSLAYADMTHDPRRPSRNPGELAVIEGIFGCVRVWRERGRTRHQLAAMSERELQDIGICRSDIASEIGRPFWRAFASNALP